MHAEQMIGAHWLSFLSRQLQWKRKKLQNAEVRVTKVEEASKTKIPTTQELTLEKSSITLMVTISEGRNRHEGF